MSDDPSERLEFGSRFAFLEALSVQFPKLLDNLKSQVLAPHSATWEVCARQHVELAQLRERALTDRQLFAALAAFDAWSSEHHIVDLWFLAAVIWTVYGLIGSDEVRWWYVEPDLNLGRFVSGHAAWIPHDGSEFADKSGLFETRAAWSKRTTADFLDDRNRYIRNQERIWSSGKLNLNGHAGWTAQRFIGLGYEEIAELWFRNHDCKTGDPVETVRRAVSRFVKRIGLTLPQHPRLILAK